MPEGKSESFVETSGLADNPQGIVEQDKSSPLTNVDVDHDGGSNYSVGEQEKETGSEHMACNPTERSELLKDAEETGQLLSSNFDPDGIKEVESVRTLHNDIETLPGEA
eukprot:CAMPEP_0184512816 /NCGR_PEP_ID=MMETSP0198_2-20121128/3086_1 /TAXON_ID=1112570 /ORGANISM="Thraustochytrium sp., Strain LLF1b" /LENGTH=108 /DNA_ID=CAMNT_0026902873 /DNA_START=105 /DNA_END=427 /DNA_ORIENTATION=+